MYQLLIFTGTKESVSFLISLNICTVFVIKNTIVWMIATHSIMHTLFYQTVVHINIITNCKTEKLFFHSPFCFQEMLNYISMFSISFKLFWCIVRTAKSIICHAILLFANTVTCLLDMIAWSVLERHHRGFSVSFANIYSCLWLKL